MKVSLMGGYFPQNVHVLTVLSIIIMTNLNWFNNLCIEIPISH